MITKETIMEAYLFLRKENQSVPSETLEFMKDTALAELQKSGVKNLGIHSVSNAKRTFCNNCKSGLIDYPDINRRTCRCGALGYNVTE